jgi:hypothetical protein
MLNTRLNEIKEGAKFEADGPSTDSGVGREVAVLHGDWEYVGKSEKDGVTFITLRRKQETFFGAVVSESYFKNCFSEKKGE